MRPSSNPDEHISAWNTNAISCCYCAQGPDPSPQYHVFMGRIATTHAEQALRFENCGVGNFNVLGFRLSDLRQTPYRAGPTAQPDQRWAGTSQVQIRKERRHPQQAQTLSH